MSATSSKNHFNEAIISFLKEFKIADDQISNLENLAKTGKVIFKDSTNETGRIVKIVVDGLKGFSLSFVYGLVPVNYTDGKSDMKFVGDEFKFKCGFGYKEHTLNRISKFGLEVNSIVTDITENRRLTNTQKVAGFCKVATLWKKPDPSKIKPKTVTKTETA